MSKRRWPTIRTGEVADLISGYAFKSSDFTDTGIPVVKIKNIIPPIIDINDVQCVSFDKLETQMRYILDYNDVLISLTGSNTNQFASAVGKVGRVKIKNTPLFLNQRVAKFVISDESGFNLDFLYYIFSTNEMKYRLASRAAGSANQANISPTLIKSIEIPCPPLSDQITISRLLMSLDETIEINKKINNTLEQIAQTLFKHWFIDFEFPCLPENYSPDHEVKVGEFSGARKPVDFEKICTYKRVGGMPVPDGKKWFVYVLLCQSFTEDGHESEEHSFYKGITNDLYRRFYEHYTGQGADWTKSHKPVKIIHYEEFETQRKAAEREKELKTGYGRTWIEREYKKMGLPAYQSRLMQAGEMINSKVGLIPIGWSANRLDKFIKFIKGKKPKRISNQWFENSVQYLTIDNLSSGSQLYCSKEKVIIAHEKDILMVMDGASSGAIYYGKDGAVGSTLAKINTVDSGLNEVIYGFLRYHKKFIMKNTTGSAIPHADKNLVNELIMPIPINQTIVQEYDSLSSNIRNIIITNKTENMKLKLIRDALLPKLMSGELNLENIGER